MTKNSLVVKSCNALTPWSMWSIIVSLFCSYLSSGSLSLPPLIRFSNFIQSQQIALIYLPLKHILFCLQNFKRLSILDDVSGKMFFIAISRSFCPTRNISWCASSLREEPSLYDYYLPVVSIFLNSHLPIVQYVKEFNVSISFPFPLMSRPRRLCEWSKRSLRYPSSEQARFLNSYNVS